MSSETYSFEEDFQQLIVATALKDPQFLLQYDDVLLPGYFDYEYLSSIMRTARGLAEKLNAVPTKASIVEEIKEFCKTFSLSSADSNMILTNVEHLYSLTINDIEYVRTKVVEFGQRQSLRAAVMKIVQLFNDKKVKHADSYDKARTILEEALRVGLDTRDLGLSLYPNLDKIPSMANDTVSGYTKKVKTGFETIDSKTEGGPSRGEVWVVVGLPGRGKSAFLTNIGSVALKHGLPVVHITIGDLNQVDVGVRYAARLTMTSTYDVTHSSAEYMKKARMLMKYDPHLYIKYFPSDTATMGHIRSYLSKLRSIHDIRPAVTIIDYPEELKMPVKDNLYLSGGANYSAMNRMANEFDSLFYAASQPQRWKPEHERDIIRGINMGESWKKFQKVDGMMSWNMTEEEEMFGRGRVWVDKTRRAKSFYLVHCEVDLSRMLIKEGKPPKEEVLGKPNGRVSDSEGSEAVGY